MAGKRTDDTPPPALAGSLLSWQPPDSWTPSKSAGAARALSIAATKRLLGEASPSRCWRLISTKITGNVFCVRVTRWAGFPATRTS